MSEVDDDSPMPTTLGRYRVVRRLGAGGMAEVFLAKSTGAEGIEKVLVVKRVLPTFARNVKFISMFVDEAKVAMRLNHPNIVQVYAFEQVRDQFLLAMEFVDGVDLGRLVAAAHRRRIQFPFGIASYIVLEIARGLDYAHNRRDEHAVPMDIVHRDVSPQNVLLSYEGTVKMADFGIARARMVTEETGVIKGKFSYMSPEQARGEKVDRRSDVYALGVVLAELLMGRSMYPGQHGLDVLEQVRKGVITMPREVLPTVPEELEAIVGKCIAFDKEHRYESARSVATALGGFLHGMDRMYDSGALEDFVARVSPREVTSPGEVGAEESAEESAAHSATANVGTESRERRHVVVVAGAVRRARPPGRAEVGTVIGDDAVRVLADIAFKADAVLSWTDAPGGGHFRLILGLGRATMHDSLRATRLALDVIEAMHGLSADWPVPIAVSLGLSRGVVSTLRDTSGRLVRYEPVGQLLTVADQLSGIGQDDEVIAAGEVYRLVRRDFVFDESEAREITVPGLDSEGPRTVRGYRVLRPRTGQELVAEAPRTETRQSLVGRENELRFIREAFEEASNTRQSVFLALTGVLGVGKTALVREAIEGLETKPRVLHTECAFGAADLPFGAAVDIVREACGVDEAAPAEEVRAKLAALVGGLVIEDRDRRTVADELEHLVLPSRPLASASEDDERGEDRFPRMVNAVRMMLGGLARQTPLIVWVDGFQWADSPSVRLVSQLVQRSYGVPLMVILSHRPDDRIAPVIANVPKIELGELHREEQVRLIQARFEGARVAHDVEEAILDRGGGNPFFLIELVEALVERGVVAIHEEGGVRTVTRRPNVPIALPTTLEDVIAARLSELAEAERLAVRWLAVAGPGFRAHELSHLAGVDLSRAIDELERRELVVRRPGDTFAFSNAVIRHVAYGTADEEDRRWMHRRVGAHLASAGAFVPPVKIAHHLERAGDRVAAADAYLDAAQGARSVYSNRDALRFYARALALLPVDSFRRFAAHEAREQMLRGMGRRDEQRLELNAMNELAKRVGDPAMLALACNRLARFKLDAIDKQGVDEVLEQALDAAAAAGDRGAEIEALRLSANLAREQGDILRSLEACDRALEVAGYDTDLLAGRGSALAQRGIALLYLGRLEEALRAGIEGMVIFRRLGIKRNESYVLNGLGVVLASMGDFEEAIRIIRTSIMLDREIGDRFHLGRKLSNVGQLYALLGISERALEFLYRALDVFKRVDDSPGQSDASTAVAEVLIEVQDDAAGAAKWLDEARVAAGASGRPFDFAKERVVRAALEAHENRLDAAEACAREAVELSGKAGNLGYSLLGRATLADILARQGRAELAHAVAGDVRDELKAAGRVDRSERIYKLLGDAYRRGGENDIAASCFRDAADVVDRCLGRIRDPELRDRYVNSHVVKSIRAALA